MTTLRLLPLGLALALVGGCDDETMQALVGPAYVDNVVDQKCSDAGTLVQPPAAAVAVEAECSGNAYFGHEAAVPLTGIAASSFSARAPSVRCRSQSNVICDFRFLVSVSPSDVETYLAETGRDIDDVTREDLAAWITSDAARVAFERASE